MLVAGAAGQVGNVEWKGEWAVGRREDRREAARGRRRVGGQGRRRVSREKPWGVQRGGGPAPARLSLGRKEGGRREVRGPVALPPPPPPSHSWGDQGREAQRRLEARRWLDAAGTLCQGPCFPAAPRGPHRTGHSQGSPVHQTVTATFSAPGWGRAGLRGAGSVGGQRLTTQGSGDGAALGGDPRGRPGAAVLLNQVQREDGRC